MRTATRTRHHDGRANPQREQRHTHGDHRCKPTALDRMLAQRNRLADKLFEVEAHFPSDALDVAQLLGATEDAIRNLSPTTYRTHVNRWAEDDAQREHTPDDPRPDTCLTCAYQADTGTHRASA